MGEVYRARDARLGRELALKVLPMALAADAERLKRFEKEARSASALNHPNLVTIHDIGSSNGVEFIAMELVEGRTLREILADGALTSRTLFGIAAQTADGLAKAHGAGIVHRDLKPENLMVSKDGFVKILDFGLAKLTQPEDTSDRTAAPTVSGATEPGVVMGTAGYMSPEQALGRPVDFRSDQFSLGSILYEMATGKRAFERGSAPETLTAIIRDEPEPIGRLAPAVAGAVFLDRRALPGQERRRPVRLDPRPRAGPREPAGSGRRDQQRSGRGAGGGAETPGEGLVALGGRRGVGGSGGRALGRGPAPGGGRAVARRPFLRRAAGRRPVRERRDRGTARDLSRRTQARFRRRSARAPAALSEIARFARDAAAGGHRRRDLPLLVARLALSRILRGRQAPAAGFRGSSPDHRRGVLSRDASELGLRRADSLRSARTDGPRPLRRRRVRRAAETPRLQGP